MSEVDEISARVEADRAQLAQSLDALTETVNPKRIATEVSSKATEIGGAFAHRAWEKVRTQPAGGALVSLGLALLAAGTRRKAPATHRRSPAMADPVEAMDGFDARVAEADAKISAGMSGQLQPSPEASRLKAALNAGLDKLPAEGRKRVRAAREAAIAAQETVERKARRAARKTERFVYEQPLTVGALALGFGLLAGTLLPSTRREDALLGARRDALMDEARIALDEEMRKLKDNAEAALSRAAG